MPVRNVRLVRRVGLRFPAWCAGLLYLAALTACGGDTDPGLPPTCDPGSAWDGDACQPFARRTAERLATPWSEGGRALTLEMIVYRPLEPPGASGRYPTLVFHHGSTGGGNDPSLFTVTFESQSIARTFTARGFQVLFPQRRGRGKSDGVYDEGFAPDRSGYSCAATWALPGLTRALEDAVVIADAVRVRNDVDTSRLLAAGFSRGGLLAMLHAARTSGTYRGAINFVGGWLGESCIDAVEVNRGSFSSAAPGGPASLWLYGENDPFYSTGHSQANHAAYIAAGGQGSWHVLRRADPSASGHNVHVEPGLWTALLDQFLQQVMPQS